jgi:hypothetical protein
MKQKDGIWMGFDIIAGRGTFPRPEKIVFWDEKKFKQVEPEAPFHFAADALVGLSLIHLNQRLQNPFITPKMNFSFANESWQALEPHHELYARSQPRIQALRDSMKAEPSQAAATFERGFSEVLNSALEPWGLDFTRLQDLLECIESLEVKQDRPLLYDFRLRFSRETLARLHYLHSLLFNLRALLAMDFNAHMQDPTHEAAKVDSITDYLPKAEYVANDALLYWSFKRCREEMPKATAEKMEQAFFTYSHNGAALIENLPKSFLGKMKNEDLEETLYLVQMDWLLGTDAGLLFRVREELYGLYEGYEKVFYPELIGKPTLLDGPLSVNCQITTQTLYPTTEVA